MLQRALSLTGIDLSPEKCEQLDRIVSARYLMSARERVVMFPGLLPLLDALQRRGTWMAICTNQLEAHARTLLAIFELDTYFREVVGRNTFAVHKPNPVPLAWLAGRCGVKPHQLLMIGDSEVDAQSAVHAGTGLVLMEHGYGDGRAISKYLRCPDFLQLKDCLRGVPGQSLEKTSLAV
jgi:phosphoglycolate phosphatase